MKNPLRRSTNDGVRVDLRQRMYVWYRTIDGHELLRGFEAGLQWLRTNQRAVNALNVYPVPDGDTGTNMVLTMQAAWNEIESFESRPIDQVALAIADGALRGARGNSGVILSQLWRGFARAVEGHAVIDAGGFTAALCEARDTAYRSVVHPVEGTILTVANDAAEAALLARSEGVDSLLELLERTVQAADASVRRTPELLPVLKEAGVVDSGGLGLFLILEGMLRSAYAQPLDKPLFEVEPLDRLHLQGAADASEPGQDWEVVVDFEPEQDFDLQAFYGRLDEMGTSIQVGEGEGMYRMHIHVPDEAQYEPIDYIRTFGTITKVAIENLMIQTGTQRLREAAFGRNEEAISPGAPCVVAVAPGAGFAHIFANLGAWAVVRGGQTMNPSTEDILTAFEDMPTEDFIILPNNSNVRMAAQQAAELSGKRAVVVPTTSPPQGIAAMFCVDPESNLDRIVSCMTEAIQEIRTAEVTVSTREVELDGVKVREGQMIGLLEGRLVSAGDDLEEVLLELLQTAAAEASELVSLYYGSEMDSAGAQKLAEKIRVAYPELEVEVLDGGQPHYLLILSLE